MKATLASVKHPLATLTQIAKNSPLIAVSGINALLTVLSVILSLLIVRVLPKAEYGHLVYFYAGFGLLRLLMNLGLGISMSRDIAAASNQGDKLREVVYSSVMVRLASILILLGGLFGLASLTEQPYLGYIAAAGIAASLADMVFAMITGLRLMRPIAWMTAIQPLTYALAAFALVFAQSATSEALMSAYGLSFVIMGVFGVYFVVQSGRIPRPTRHSFRWQYLHSILLFAIPVYSATLASQAWSSICAGILGWRGDFQRSAEFGVVFNLLGLVISITASTLVTTFFPQVSHFHSQQKPEQLSAHIRKTVTLLFQGYLFVGIVLFAFSDTVVDVLFSELYRPSAAYLTILAPVVLTLGLTPIFTLTLVGIGRPWHALIGVTAQLGGFVAIVLGLPGELGPDKLSWAALLSSLLGLLVNAGLCVKWLKRDIIPARVLTMSVLGVLAAVVLRLLEGQIGMALTPWHFVVGVGFTLLYWTPILLPRVLR